MDYNMVVKIKNISDVSESSRKYFSNEMQKYSGKSGKIVGIEEAIFEDKKVLVYKIDVDSGIFFWREDFLEE